MAVKLHTKTINGVSWGLNTLPATDGIDVLTKLAGIVGSGVGQIDGIGDIKNIADLKDKAVGAAVGAICASLAQPGTSAMIGKLLTGLTKDKAAVMFDNEFSGEYGLLVQIVTWALEINFASFFNANPVISALTGALGKQGPPVQ